MKTLREPTTEEEATKIITKSDLTDSQLEDRHQLIRFYMDLFSKADDDYGDTDIVKHRIDLIDEKLFKQRYRGIPPSAYDELHSHLRQLLYGKIIRPSKSPFASTVVLARKDNTLLLCVDYPQLNNQTIRESYALPRIEDLLDCLTGSRFFSSVTMKLSRDTGSTQRADSLHRRTAWFLWVQ